MPRYQCELLRWRDLSNGDAFRYAFTFRLLPLDKLGEPEEGSAAETREVTVGLSGTLVAGVWRLAPSDVVRVAYWLALDRGLAERAALVEFTTATAPATCPCDPDRVPFETARRFFIDIDPPPIGFHPR